MSTKEMNIDNLVDDFHTQILNSIFEFKNKTQLVKHQLESFNDFISKKIPEIVKQYNPIIVYHEYDENNNAYKKEIHVEFDNIYMGKPIIHENNGSSKIMVPHEAKLRNFTYSSPLFVDIKITFLDKKGDQLNIIEKKEKQLNKIMIGKIPIMVKSNYCVLDHERHNLGYYGECEHDFGGYFIINGSEKVLVCQERQAENKPYVFNNSKQNTKYSHIVEVKSTPSHKLIPSKSLSIKLTSKANEFGRTFKVTLPHVRIDIPIIILFRLLGIESDKEIIEYILLEDYQQEEYLLILKPSIEEANAVYTQTMAFEYLLKYLIMMGNPKEIKMDNDSKICYLKKYINDDILPHLGEENKKKALFLGIMVKKLINLYLQRVPQDDRDSYVNKRIDTPGILMSNIFRQYFTKLIKDMRNSIMKELSSGSWKTFDKLDEVINLTNIYKIIKSTTIEIGLKYSLATGNWGMKNSSKKVGVAQVLSRLSYNSTLSHLRRLNTPIEKTGKLIPPRKLHSTTWGYICPAETPEGASVGIVKNLSLLSTISIYNSSESIIEILNEYDIELIENTSIKEIIGKDKIFVNGDFIGVSSDAYSIYLKCIEFRRIGTINIFSTIYFDYHHKELYFYTDAGRLLRPLLIVSNNDLLLKQDYISLLQQGNYNLINLLLGNGNKDYIEDHGSCIEFVDVQESNNLLIANNINDLRTNKNSKLIKYYTHCEVHSSAMLGVLASAIPFPDHNQSPRNTYQSAMGKQAMGIYTTNYRNRMDTLAHILHYPSIPIVNTILSKYLNSIHTPNGAMVTVAIMSGNGGYNQEDSVMINQSSVDCGMFISTFFRSYKDEEKKSQIIGKEEKFCRPNSFNTKGLKPGDYSKLDENGFAKVNSVLNGGDIIIGKHLPCKENKKNSSGGLSTNKFRDSSTSLRSNESGIVDKVFQNRNGDGYRFCKLRMRSERIPQIGDKFSSRHGQKGTVGMVYQQQDMPYSKDGIVPDIIINPHAIPSRMTIGQLVECITGKACCMLGLQGDGTPFTNLTVNEIGDILQNEAKLERHGNEVLYNGFTGRQLECSIFIGPTYYQRLKHMVDDKIHSRSSGPLVLLTRQPSEGRSRDGGLRFGEMERDCMIAHGVSVFQKERLMDMSDNYYVYICKKTGMISAVNKEKNIYNSFSSNTTDFSEIRIPYAYKLLVQELQTMGICTRLVTG